MQGGIEVFETLAFSELQQSSMEKKRRYGYFVILGVGTNGLTKRIPVILTHFVPVLLVNTAAVEY